MRRYLTLIVWAAALLLIPKATLAAGVSPALLDLSASRGEVMESEITVLNTSAADQTYSLEAIKFLPGEGDGTPQFVPYEEDHSGLPEWIQFDEQQFTVPAGSTAEIPVVIAVPLDVASGGYYAAILVAQENGGSIHATIAVLVLLTVEGETTAQAALLDFVTPDGPLTVVPSMSYAYSIQNQGNVHLKPEATITARDMFGRILFVQNANTEEARVLPGTTRKFGGEFNPRPASFIEMMQTQARQFAVGPVSYTLDVRYAEDAEPLTATIEGIWMLPVQLLFAVVLFIAVGSLLYLFYTRFILKRSTSKT